jgi:general secretion pathway protein A
MYLNFYNLKEEPFRLTPDPKFLQLAEPHRLALMTLAQGVIGRKGLMILSGPVGTGKTTILNGFLSVLARTFPQKAMPTALIINPRLSPKELLETLLYEFEVSHAFDSKPCRIAALQGLMFAASKAGGTCLLIVDEAHLLPIDVLEEIRLLMNADSYKEKLLQVVLCGQPELSDLLRDPALRAVRQRISVRATLRELSPSETRMYIAERLRIAGLEKAVPFTSCAFDKIYEYTGGVPRLINIACDASLALGCETGRGQIGEDIVEEIAVRHELESIVANKKPSLSILPTHNVSSLSAKTPSRSEL